MIAELGRILEFVWGALARSWWLLLITVPVAALVNVSGASGHIRKAVSRRPAVAILLATLVGALSPLCSCTVIPMIFSLLVGGVPLAPVMAFWMASPSMDVEIFFLSASTLGWELAVWRLASTFALSLAAGFITHALSVRGWVGDRVLRRDPRTARFSFAQVFRSARRKLTVLQVRPEQEAQLAATSSCCAASASTSASAPGAGVITLVAAPPRTAIPGAGVAADGAARSSCGCGDESPGQSDKGCNDGSGGSCSLESPTAPRITVRRLAKEMGSAVLFVSKFLILAFVLEALIVLYVPESWILALLGSKNALAVPTAAVIGLPAYTSSLAALGLVGGLLQKGMLPAAALAFLISGPTTTLPAMSAVFGVATRRVFALYLAFAFGGAILMGYGYRLAGLLF